MRLTWLTNIHLNFLTIRSCEDFYAEIAESKPDAVVISGVLESLCVLALERDSLLVLGFSMLRIRARTSLDKEEQPLLEELIVRKK